eukprot:TRINITY_DN21783_c0_g1_i1.p1 TRINITY_DN21783_c0_g1~~TRINITY_DN21783_c0_g1_i1.p1  ORF type:complete len:197 (-),score=36.94 TRINITY_DN21783_c0_g1_i1:34-624(-)
MDTEELVATLLFGALLTMLITYALRSSQTRTKDATTDRRTVPGTSGSFTPIPDNYNSLGEITAALRRAGLECSELIVGVDFTKSNEWTGQHSFGARCLHELDHTGARPNPYQTAIRVVGTTLEAFDEDGLIPAFGFGCAQTKDRTVCLLYTSDAADEEDSVDLGGRGVIKKKKISRMRRKIETCEIEGSGLKEVEI